MKKYLKPFLAVLACYIAMLVLLVAAESSASNASIRTFWDAVWYSIVTVTTIGYGDLTPVSTFGRVLGIVFAICSIGVITTLITISLKIMTGELLPSFRMFLVRNKTWYVFNEVNEESMTLMWDLLSSEKDSLMIVNAPNTKKVTDSRIVYCDMPYLDILKLRKSNFDGLSMFFFGENELKNYSNALCVAKRGIETYFKSNSINDIDTDHMNLVDVSECISRTYWGKHPLTRERIIVLIGCGDVGSALLERAIITNVSDKDEIREYHVFSHNNSFITNHPKLIESLSDCDGQDDCLSFHHEDWRENYRLLAAADRIIICEDNEMDNIQIYQSVVKWFPVHSLIHLLSTTSFPHAIEFGDVKEIFTKQIVMKDQLNKCAEMLNDIYNKNVDNPIAWKNLPTFLRQSNIAAADHVIVKIRYLLNDDSLVEVTEENCEKAYNEYCARKEKDADVFQEMEHRRWVRFHKMYNWTSGEVKNTTLREHPNLVPYSDLTDQDKQKNAYSWELLGYLAAELKKMRKSSSYYE